MSIQERIIGFCVLAVLVLITVVILWTQSQFNLSQWRLQPEDQKFAQPLTGLPQERDLPVMDSVVGLKPLTNREIYSTDTLSDKINGKAELYLSAGFKSLFTRRFALVEDTSIWMERYVYDMGGYRNAYAVFTAQRRSSAQPLSLTTDGYISENGLFLVHGPFYLEIIAAQASPTAMAAARDLAAAFVHHQAVEIQTLDEAAFFPPQDQVPGSQSVIAEHAFGIDGFNWVYTALYKRDGAEAMAFISKSAGADEARARAEAFADYFLEYGGDEVEREGLPPMVRMITIMDAYEVVLNTGLYVVGVHEATDPDLAVEVIAAIQQRIGKGKGD